jgi:hypothetical protein
MLYSKNEKIYRPTISMMSGYFPQLAEDHTPLKVGDVLLISDGPAGQLTGTHIYADASIIRLAAELQKSFTLPGPPGMRSHGHLAVWLAPAQILCTTNPEKPYFIMNLREFT